MRDVAWLLILSSMSLYGCEAMPKVPALQDAAGQAVRDNPQDPLRWVEYGRASLFSGNSAAAEAAFRQAIELNSKCLLAHKHLGLILADQQRHDEAKSVYEQAVRLPDADSELWTAYGYCLAAAAEDNKAAEAFKEAIKLNTNPVSVVSSRLGLSGLLSRQGKHGEAKIEYDEAVKTSPEVARLLAERAKSGRE